MSVRSVMILVITDLDEIFQTPRPALIRLLMTMVPSVFASVKIIWIGTIEERPI